MSRRNESHRRLRHVSATRPRSRTTCAMPRSVRYQLVARPAWPAPMTTELCFMSLSSGLGVEQAGGFTALPPSDTLFAAERAEEEDSDDGGAGDQGEVEGPVDDDQSLKAGVDAVHVGVRPPADQCPAGTGVGGHSQSSHLCVAEQPASGRNQECDAGAESE